MLQTNARAVIADDERLMREQLRARLQQVWPSLDIVAEAKNGMEAVEAVKTHRPDVIFLDIRMPGLTGVEAAKEIAQLDLGDDALLPEMVFITAYDQYAIDAFEHGAVDYVLKPAEPTRLKLTAERLQRRLSERSNEWAQASPNSFQSHQPVHSVQQGLHALAAQMAGKVPNYLSLIQASVGQSIHMLPIQDVLYFVSDEKYTRVQTAQQEFLIRKPIKELVDALDPQNFLQIHRSTLVSVSAIESVQKDERGRVWICLRARAEKLAVSRSAASLFRAM
jgi:DNA-binding LytR/AlgR family response regulator